MATVKKSMIEVAFDVLSSSKNKKGVSFNDLFAKVVKDCNITDEEKNKKLVMFYNNLTLDGRFCHLEGKDLWALRHTADTTINYNEADNESAEMDEDEAEDKEKAEAEDEENNSDDSNESN